MPEDRRPALQKLLCSAKSFYDVQISFRPVTRQQSKELRKALHRLDIHSFTQLDRQKAGTARARSIRLAAVIFVRSLCV